MKQVIVDGDNRYVNAPGIGLNFESTGKTVKITATDQYGQMLRRPVETCAHCHNFYFETVVAYSFEEAEQFGWLVRTVSA